MVNVIFPYPALLRYFEEISAIPRASYHEEKIADYLVAFAQKRGLSCYRDAVHNVLIDLPATAGYEDRPPLLLQGHTDMVCEKNIGCEHDFSKDGLELYVEDGYLRARGTTLGADDGIAVAMMLWLADSKDIPHPACQCLFTSAEEVGMDGVINFDYSRIYARRLINMDSPDEYFVTVGCAGGVRTDVKFLPEWEEAKGEALRLRLIGLAGGHSGENIADGRANANKLMARALAALGETVDFSMASWSGGSKSNAIPREAEAIIVTEDAERVYTKIAEIEAEIASELCADDADFSLKAEKTVSVARMWTKEFTERVITFACAVQNGIIEMSKQMQGVVEYSRNLGVIVWDGEFLKMYFSSRSAIDGQLEDSQRMLERLAKLCGGEARHHNRYPGWRFAGGSPLLDAYHRAFAKVYGEEPRDVVLHAGLECGVIHHALPGLDAISCGPNAHDLHSPDEKLDLASFGRFAEVILALLAE